MKPLRENADFRRLWLAQTISQIGSQVSYLALPLTAAVALGATPAQMGVLTALGSLPALLVGLFAGALVDRRRRRPVLIWSDLGRAALLGSIPIAWAAGGLRIELLYVVAFLAGLLTLLFDIAYQAFLPAVVAREHLMEGNSRLELSRSAAELAGPPLAGGLIQLLTAPVALAADALSYVGSALLIGRIERHEPGPESGGDAGLLRDVREGLRAVARDPRIRALAGTAAIIGLFNAMLEAVHVLFLVRELGMAPGLLGVVFAAGSGGFLVGALLPERLAARIGIGPAMAAALVLVGLSDLLVPFAGGSMLAVALLVGAAQLCFGVGLTVYQVAQTSLRQAIVPERLQGRVGGTIRVLGWGLVPIGALLGGVSGELIGLRATLAVAAACELLAAAWIWRSSLWDLRAIPVLAPE